MYSAKLDFYDSLKCYKAWPVALENKQEYEINYDETFALVAKMTTMRTMHLLLPLKVDTFIKWMWNDVFLHDVFTKVIYIVPPQGLFSSSKAVCKLERSLYHLQQSHYTGNEKSRSTHLELSFTHIVNLFIHCINANVVFFSSMLRMWSLLYLIMHPYTNLDNIYKSHFTWNTSAVFTIF